jgi:hypothetical protein
VSPSSTAASPRGREPDGPAASALVVRRLATLGRLAGSLAHAFNNQLTAILGYADLLLADIDPAYPGRPDLLEIKLAGERAASLTRKLLAFNRGGNDVAQLLCWPALIEELRPLVVEVLGESVCLEVHCEQVPDVLAHKADAGHLLFAVVLAARSALPAGGACRFFVATCQGRDGGAGVAVDATFSDPAGSSNPVLKEAVVGELRALASLQGADCDVLQESAAVHLRICYPAALDTATSPARAVTSAGGGRHVLLVEDDDGLRDLLSRLLSRDGYVVTAAASGREALSVLDAQPAGVALLVTDVVMPGMSGADLAREVVARAPAVRALFISGHADAATRDLASVPAVSRFLAKPFSGEQLSAALRELRAAE